MSHPVPTSATVVFADLAIGDVIPIAHCTPHGKHTSPYVIGGRDLVDGLIHLQLYCTATSKTMQLVGAPESTTRRIPTDSAVCPDGGQLPPCSTATPGITHGERDYLNPALRQTAATRRRPYSCSHDLTGVQQLLLTRPGAVVLDPGGHSLGLDLSTSLLATNPDAMLSAVRGVYRHLRMRLVESEKAGMGFWPRDPLAGRVRPPGLHQRTHQLWTATITEPHGQCAVLHGPSDEHQSPPTRQNQRAPHDGAARPSSGSRSRDLMSAGGYHWRPLGAEYVPVHRLVAGDLIGLDHRVWHVVSVSERPADLAGKHPWVLVVQVPGVNTPGRDEHHLPCQGWATVPVFRTPHYPICACCHEPVPCRDVMIERTVEQARQRAARYSDPGICPSCTTPITAHQAAVSFETNLVVPLGPPVTFHTRRRCSSDLAGYDKKWIAAGNQSKLCDPDIAPTLTSDRRDRP